jgi:hypothetical protein
MDAETDDRIRKIEDAIVSIADTIDKLVSVVIPTLRGVGLSGNKDAVGELVETRQAQEAMREAVSRLKGS